MPTFIFLKGSAKVDQVRGADPSALEEAIRKHAGSSSASTATFTGKGHTLGGGPAPSNLSGEAKRVVDNAAAGASAAFTNVDPQIKVLLGLIGLYGLFWYLA